MMNIGNIISINNMTVDRDTAKKEKDIPNGVFIYPTLVLLSSFEKRTNYEILCL